MMGFGKKYNGDGKEMVSPGENRTAEA